MSTKKSKAFGTKHPLKPHLLQQTGGLAAEVKDIRDDVESAFLTSEARTGFPIIDYIDGGVPLAGGDIVIKGRNLLQGQTFDSIVLAQSTMRLTLTMLAPGDSGATVQVIAGAGALSVTYNPTTKAMVITLAAGGSTIHNIATEINKDSGDCDGYIRATETVAGTMTTAQAAQDFTGGTGLYTGNLITVAGAACLPANQTGDTTTAKWSDTQITATVPSLVALGLATEDLFSVTVTSDGLESTPLTVGGEKLTSGTPELTWLDGTSPAAAGGDIVLKGVNLLQGQTFDSLQRTEVGGADITVYAVTPGDSGITVEIVAGAGALSVTFVAPALTITLAAGGSTDDAIATEINKNGGACDGFIRAVSAGGGSFTLAQASAPMTGGTGSYADNVVSVAGVACKPYNQPGTTSVAAWTATQIDITVPNLAGKGAGDIAQVTATVNGLKSPPLSAALV